MGEYTGEREFENPLEMLAASDELKLCVRSLTKLDLLLTGECTGKREVLIGVRDLCSGEKAASILSGVKTNLSMFHFIFLDGGCSIECS